jgi:hypothetical protein
LGGSSNNNYPAFPIASPMAMTGFPMSPVNPLASLYGNNPNFSSTNQNNPWQNKSTNLTKNNFANATTMPVNNSMNGIWQALSGDIIAIYYNSKFIWTNGKERHLAGSLVIKESQLTAYISSTKKVIQFTFYRQGNKFAVKDKSGQIHIFTRIH